MSMPTTQGRPGGASYPAVPMRIQILLALRAGPMESMQLEMRYGAYACSAATALAREGLVRMVDAGAGNVYRLTEAGRAACPSRRQVERVEVEYSADHDDAEEASES